jgi:ABC-type bacteriocin/lantibiotic exporter with double-glycine peptidase domain
MNYDATHQTPAKNLFSRPTPPQLDDLPYKDYDPEVTASCWSLSNLYRKIWISVFYMAISSLAAVTGPYLLQVAIDDGIDAAGPGVCAMSRCCSSWAAIIQWFFNYIRVNIMAKSASRSSSTCATRSFKRLQELSLSFFNRYSVAASQRA